MIQIKRLLIVVEYNTQTIVDQIHLVALQIKLQEFFLIHSGKTVQACIITVK